MAEIIGTKHIGDTPRDCPMGDCILRRTTAGIVVSASLQTSNPPRQFDPSCPTLLICPLEGAALLARSVISNPRPN